MTQFTLLDAYELLLHKYTMVVAERTEIVVERDDLQEMLDSLWPNNAENQDDVGPEDYVSSKDFDELSKRYEKLENMLRAERETYDDLHRRYYSNITKAAGDELARLKTELAKTTEELGKTLEDNAHLNSQLNEEIYRGDSIFSDKTQLKKENEDLRQENLRVVARNIAIAENLNNLKIENAKLKVAAEQGPTDDLSTENVALQEIVADLKVELHQTIGLLNEADASRSHNYKIWTEEVTHRNRLLSENADLKNTIAALRKIHPESTEAEFFRHHYNRALDEIGYLEATIADLRKETQKWTHPDLAAFEIYQKLRGR